MCLALALVKELGLLEIEFLLRLENARFQQLRTVRSQVGIGIEHLLYNSPQINRVVLWNSLYLS